MAASLSYVETRQVGNGYTIQFDNQTYQIARGDIRAGMRGADVRVEVQLDASVTVRYGERYLTVTACQSRPKVTKPKRVRKPTAPPREKSVDEELPSHRSGENGSVGNRGVVPGPWLKTHLVGRAKAARPASRFVYPKTAARKLHQSGCVTKNQNPQNGQH